MPDPNQTTQNQNDQAATAPSSVSKNIPVHTDLPPMPDFMNDAAAPTPAPSTASDKPADDSNSTVPSDLPPMIVTPKKKFGGGKIIATILGVLLLVGGVGTGIYLTQQNQNPQSQAAKTNPEDIGNPHARQVARAELATSQAAAAEAAAAKIDQYTIASNQTLSATSYDPNTTLPYKDGGYSQEQVLNMQAPLNSNKAGAYCSGGSCPQESDTDIAGYYKINNKYYPIAQTFVGGGGGDTTTTPTPTPSPSPTPGPTAVCSNLKAYSSTWTLLTTANLSALKSGNTVNFCVTGSASSGVFDKARFTINGVLKAETTTVRPGSTDFCQSYTIPAATATFNVSGELHHPVLGWF